MVGQAADNFVWRITRHACRACMGRVLMRDAGDHRSVYRCSNCGAEREGRAPAVLCCCGIRFGRAQRDGGVRCVQNTAVTPECMSEIVAAQVVGAGSAAVARAKPGVVDVEEGED